MVLNHIFTLLSAQMFSIGNTRQKQLITPLSFYFKWNSFRSSFQITKHRLIHKAALRVLPREDSVHVLNSSNLTERWKFICKIAYISSNQLLFLSWDRQNWAGVLQNKTILTTKGLIDQWKAQKEIHLDNYVSFPGPAAIQLSVLLYHNDFSFLLHFVSVFFHVVQNPPVVLLGYTHKLSPNNTELLMDILNRDVASSLGCFGTITLLDTNLTLSCSTTWKFATADKQNCSISDIPKRLFKWVRYRGQRLQEVTIDYFLFISCYCTSIIHTQHE